MNFVLRTAKNGASATACRVSRALVFAQSSGSITKSVLLFENMIKPLLL
jgi:hypothetical protein